MEFLISVNDFFHSLVWGPVMLAILLGVGIYFSVRTKFFQLFHFPLAMKITLGSLFRKKESDKKRKVTPFQAVSTALAGTLGTGNIVGVSTAIVSGGPGAIFWMWVSSFFGMITKFAEVVLAIRFRRKRPDGTYAGGPMYYMEDGLHQKGLAILFSSFCIAASFGIGNMTQANAVSDALFRSFRVPPELTGVWLAVLVGIVIMGGIRRVGQFAEKLVPFASILYLLFSSIVLIFHWDKIGAAFGLIFEFAFHPQAVAGGSAGYLISLGIRYGVSRGVFSNEAGLGSAPIAHAAADTDSPVEQGMWGIFEVFFDTIVVCTITALVIFTSGDWAGGANGAALTLEAFSNTLGSAAEYLISISMLFFAFASILGWAYYGETCVEYLFHTKRATFVYRTVFLCFLIVGATNSLTFIWAVSDTLNGFMAIPNLIALIGLSSIVIGETKKYLKTKNTRK